MENFAAQDAAYRDQVLPPQVPRSRLARGRGHVRLAPWVGELGEAIGMEGFGASAPAGALVQALRLDPRARRRRRTRGRQTRALQQSRLEPKGIDMSTVIALNRRLSAITEASVGGPAASRSHGLPAERAVVGGDPFEAVRAATGRIKAILERS